MTEQTTSISLKERVFNKKTIISFIIAFFVLYLLLSQVDIEVVVHTVTTINPIAYACAFCTYYLSFPVRGYRWKVLLRNTGFEQSTRNLTEILFLSWFANTLVPAKLGDIYRGYLCKANYGISASRVIGTVFTERVYDVFSLVVVLAAASALSFGAHAPEDITFYMNAGYVLLAAVLIGFMIIGYKHRHIAKFIPHQIADIFMRFGEGASRSFVARTVPVVLLCSMIAWFLECATLFFVLDAIGLQVDIPIVVFAALFAALVTALPISPSGLGAVEVAIAMVLTVAGVGWEMAVSAAILDRIICYWCLMGIGLVMYVITDKRGNG